MFAEHGQHRGRLLGSLRGGRSRRRRTPRRGLWVLLALVLLSCLVVAAIFPRYRERPAETAMLTAVDGPASAEPPEPPVPQHGFAPSKNSTKSSEPSPKRTRVLTGWRSLTSTLERARRSTPTLRSRQPQQTVRP